MVPSLCHLWVVLASIFVPRGARTDWKREWIAELSYRERCGASNAYLLRSARGALRDALWIRAQTPLDFRFLTLPLRAECLLVLLALTVSVWYGALIPERPEYPNLDRLVRFERDMRFLGLTNKFLRSPLLENWQALPAVQQVASYNLYLRGPVPYARISPNFFDVLGVRSWNGRLLRYGDDPGTAVITYAFWRTQLHSDPHAIGSAFRGGKETYRVAGILGPAFAFNHCSFFTPLRDDSSYYTIALLKPGVTRKHAEMQLPKTADYDGARLRPLVVPFSASSLLMAAALAMVPVSFYLLRRRKITLYICARMLVALLSVMVINLATARAINRLLPILSVLQFWVFCGLCAAVVYFVLRDQRSRCPVCLERLRMPVSIGSWSSLILDRPATEYVCPAGHGVLFVSEALHDPNQWTVLDESWHDLFAETTT